MKNCKMNYKKCKNCKECVVVEMFAAGKVLFCRMGCGSITVCGCVKEKVYEVK